MKRFSKALSMLLAIIMVVGLLPLSIIAEDIQTTHTVEFKLTYNGAHKIPSQKVADGECAVQPENVTREGWIFEYWYVKTGDGIQKFDLSQPITEDVTLYARWEEDITYWGPIWSRNILDSIADSNKNVTYTVTFDGNGENVENIPEAQNVKKGECAVEPSEPTRTGYHFGGWYTDAALTVAYDFTAVVTADITLYAKWTVNAPEGTYRVTFNSNGGTPVEEQLVQSGNVVIQPADPEKADSRFIAWYSDAELTSVWDFATPVTTDITLYAKWEAVIEDPSILDEPNPEVEIYSFTTDTWDILIGTTATVTFTAEIFSEYLLDDNSICVMDSTGALIGYMTDKGINGDMTANDGIFTLRIDLYSDTVKAVKYYAQFEDTTSSSLTISYYKSISPEDIEEFNDVVALLNDWSADYLDDNGYLIVEKYDDAVAYIETKLDELIEDGIVSEYSVSEYCFYIKLSSGIPMIHQFAIEGADNKVVISNQPYKNTYNASLQSLSDAATDGSARKIEETFDEYDFNSNTSGNELNTANDGNYDLTEVSLAALRNMANADVITWHGHGGYSATIGSFIGTGDTDPNNWVTYSGDISADRIVPLSSGAFGISGGFIERYVGDMTGKFIYLGTCSSGEDMLDNSSNTFELAQEFIDKGITAVIANSATICTRYNASMERDVFSYLCEVDEETSNYHTLSSALAEAIDDNGNQCCSTDGARPMIFPQNNTAANNYRLTDKNTGFVAGVVKNAENGNPIKNALIRVYHSNGDKIAETRTDANGNYNLEIPAGNYVVKVSAGFYKTAKMEVTVSEGQTTYNETFLLLSVNTGILGYANGIITDSITGAAVPDVTIKLRLNWNNKTGIVLNTVSTNANGYYEITAPSGFYTIEYYKSGYITGYKNILVGDIGVAGQNAVISPVTSSDSYRIVLTWGENPRDLDSHMYGTLSSGSSFHVYYSHKSQYDGDVEVCNLDIDDTTSYGPETITLNATTANPYYYSIYRYAGSGTVSGSSAQIKVYRGSNLVYTFNVPVNQGNGDYWNVFAIVNGQLIIRNTITSSVELSYAN